jgi:hypothetical protein
LTLVDACDVVPHEKKIYVATALGLESTDVPQLVSSDNRANLAIQVKVAAHVIDESSAAWTS